MTDSRLIRGVPEIAAEVGVRPGSLRYWIESPDKRSFWNLGLLLFRDPSGRWCSTPRRIRHWLQWIEARDPRTRRVA